MALRDRLPLALQKRLANLPRPRHRALPTRAGLFLLGSPMVLGLAAVSSANNLLFMMLGAVLATIVLSGMMSEANLRGLSVKARPAGPIYAAEPAPIEISVHAGPGWRGRLGPAVRHVLRFREVTHNRLIPWQSTAPFALDVVLPRMEGEQGKVIGRRTFPRRGLDRLLPGELSTEYPFGLLHKVDDAEPELSVMVRPKRIPVPAALAEPSGRVSEGELSARRGAGLELYGLREREDRDAIERIHALRSLALGKEVVLETSGVEKPRALLGIANGLGADPEAFERALELAQAMIIEWDRRGFAVGLYTLRSRIEPGELSLEGMLDRLATLALEPPGSPSEPGALWLVPSGANPPSGATVRVQPDGRWSRS
ncbi:MAG: hypothetical protein IPG45_06615 [Deltaproteobacteria bacterium]|nr:hypothetical protein [Deltaproteobacteria bacterium]